MKLLIFAILATFAFGLITKELNDGAVPIVLFHGYGGACDKCLAKYLGQKLNVVATCIEPSPIPEDGPIYSKITPINVQGQRACDMINNNTDFQGEFDLVGFSQGTIMSRYIIQNCKLNGSVRNFISFGGPLNGQYPPRCGWLDLGCIYTKYMDGAMAYDDDHQENFAWASYWKDPAHYQQYLDQSTWLAEANNEVNYSEARRQSMLDLNGALFIKWDAETTISPAESSWWGGYDKNFNVIDRFHDDVYLEDLVGIKTLEEEGRALFISIPGKHMEYTFTQIDEIIIPFIVNH
jgi:palmitoyl-protein thioesterase